MVLPLLVLKLGSHTYNHMTWYGVNTECQHLVLITLVLIINAGYFNALYILVR